MTDMQERRLFIIRARDDDEQRGAWRGRVQVPRVRLGSKSANCSSRPAQGPCRRAPRNDGNRKKAGSRIHGRVQKPSWAWRRTHLSVNGGEGVWLKW
jgi:hypothetical protein